MNEEERQKALQTISMIKLKIRAKLQNAMLKAFSKKKLLSSSGSREFQTSTTPL